MALQGFKNHLLTTLGILLVGSLSYGIGKLSKLEATRTPLQIIMPEEVSATSSRSFQTEKGLVQKLATTTPKVSKAIKTPAQPKISVQKATKVKPAVPVTSKVAIPQAGAIIGVKSSKHYYFPWCGTITRLKETNAIVFDSLDAAKKAGYTAAKNCKGLRGL